MCIYLNLMILIKIIRGFISVKRQYTIGEDGVITVNKSEMDSDPFLLQRIMDQKLEGYDMPTADPVNYLNAGGSLGGPYAR